MTAPAQRDNATDDPFRRRALAEAARYGSDAWVFVRELLQNARDAGAERVELTTANDGSLERITCRDDGCGMSFAHARRFLFALYASSKEEHAAEAGKFGIGFWAVLRFEPSTIIVRSRAAGDDDGWQVALDGRLRRTTVVEAGIAEWAPAVSSSGTEVVLERPVRAGDLAEEVFAAARRYGRFLRGRSLSRRDGPGRPVTISVDGRRVNAEFSLPAPCTEFRGRGYRGVVALGSKPRVELFAHGLFVRSAASLQDLRELGDQRRRTTAEEALAELPSLAPQVLIDSARIDLLLARSDARQDRHLRQVLAAAEKALGRLITRQLQALSPQPWYRLWLGGLRDKLAPHLSWRTLSAVLTGALAAVALLWWLGPEGLRRPSPASVAAQDQPAPAATVASAPDGGENADSGGSSFLEGSDLDPRQALERALRAAAAGASPTPGSGASATSTGGSSASGGQPAFHRYSDLARSYRGPHPTALDGGGSTLALAYEPRDRTPLFNALVINDIGGERWNPRPLPDTLRPYRRIPCERGCLEVRLLLAAGAGPVRIPVPTGHRLDVSSLRFDGVATDGSATDGSATDGVATDGSATGRSASGESATGVQVFESASGEALLLAGERRGILEYRTGSAPSLPLPGGGAERRAPLPPSVPGELAAVADKIRGLPLQQRVQSALDFVARRIPYDRSPAAGRSYTLLRSAGTGFLQAALDAGGGDCDVQNGVLVSLLRLAGVDARLALGYAGLRGVVTPGLHAWVEYGDGSGRWLAADASTAALSPAPSPVAAVPLLADGSPLEPVPLAPSVENGAATPTVAVRSSQPRTFELAVGAMMVLAVVATAAAVRRRRRSSAEVALDPGGDLAALLGGALRHPGAFAQLSAMSHGRFVPLLGGAGAISLARARRLAGQRRLFRSSAGSGLAQKAAGRGVPVVDSSTPEGRVLSLALGAVDLDHWDELLERSSRTELTRRIDDHLADLGETFRVRWVSGLDEPTVEIALEDLKLGRRQVLADLAHPELAPLARQTERGLVESSETAAFTLLDLLLHRLDLAPGRRSQILEAFAVRAVAEVHGR